MRHMHKSWQDKRPGWTRRARWYEGEFDIRIEYQDEDGMVNRYYKTKDEADAEYEAFRANELSVMEFLAENEMERRKHETDHL